MSSVDVIGPLGAMTALDWFVATGAAAACLFGLLLPRIGNFIGRAVLGEDPLLQRWREARAARRALAIEQRLARRADKAARRSGRGPGA